MSRNILEKIFKPTERGKIWQVFTLVVVLVILSAMVDAPGYYNKGVDYVFNKTSIKLPNVSENPFRLGLDLQGGTHLVYEVDIVEVPAKDRDSAVEGARDVIERRVNVFGVSEPIVQVNKTASGDYRIIAELAGVKDVGEAIKMIGDTPLLEFKEEGAEDRELTEEEKKMIKEINDSADQKAKDILGKLISGGDFAEIAKEYSDDPNTKENGGEMEWITEKDNFELVNIVKDLKIGDRTEDFAKATNGYEMLKLEDKRNKKDPFSNEEEKEIKASHILVCFDGAESCENGISKEDAKVRIDEVKSKANSNNFADLAKEYSTGPSGPQGGSLGWFGPGNMVVDFENTAKAQAVGSISDVVETEFGYHIIYKEDEKSIEEYKIRHIFLGTVTEKDVLNASQNWQNTELTGKYLERSVVQFNGNDGSPEVALEFDGEGGKLFGEITDRNVGKQVAIFLDGYVISAPTVNEKITGGKAVISGTFDIKEAKLLAQRLNAGALPVPINLISQKTVGASLGKVSVESSLKAGMLGLILVAIFMILFYRLSGLLAVFSLGIYGLLVLAIFKLWPVTLTLSGLAGFILSIGMAVDANVLIFERIKEELRHGNPLRLAIKDGFERAWSSIRDGNVSTLITCVILISFFQGMVRGFAVTLFLGVMISMFSAIVITKNFLMLIATDWLENKLWLLGVKKKEE